MTKKVNLQQQELKTRSTQVIIALIAVFIIIAVVKALALLDPTEASTEEKGNTPPSVFSWVPDIESGTLKCQNEEGREDKSQESCEGVGSLDEATMHLSSLQTQHQQLILSQRRQQQLNTETNDSYDYLPKYFGDNRPYFHFRYTEQGICVNQNNVIQNPSNCVLEDRIQKWYLYPTIAGLHPLKRRMIP